MKIRPDNTLLRADRINHISKAITFVLGTKQFFIPRLFVPLETSEMTLIQRGDHLLSQKQCRSGFSYQTLEDL